MLLAVSTGEGRERTDRRVGPRSSPGGAGRLGLGGYGNPEHVTQRPHITQRADRVFSRRTTGYVVTPLPFSTKQRKITPRFTLGNLSA